MLGLYFLLLLVKIKMMMVMTRARGREIKVLAEQIAIEDERIVQSAGKMRRGGWNHSAVVEQIERRLRLGIRPNIVLDAVRVATDRAAASMER